MQLSEKVSWFEFSPVLWRQLFLLRPQLCAVHPERPFDVAEKAFWLQRDAAAPPPTKLR